MAAQATPSPTADDHEPSTLAAPHGVRRDLLVVAMVTLAACALLAIPGSALGYRRAGPYIACWILNTLLAADAWLIARRWFRGADALLRTAIIAFALVVVCGLLLGSIGLLTPLAYAVLLLALCGGLSATAGRPVRDSAMPIRLPRTPHPALLIAVPIAILVLAVGWAHPPVEYDSLSYHLFFPARWLQAHRLFVMSTPWGDQAPAYEPHNGELFFLWLMLPFHGDFLARVGQVPFYGLGAAALFALGRRLGLRPAHAVYPAALFLVSRGVMEQAVGADVDLMFAALFLVTLYFGLTAAETGSRGDVALWGLCLGLWMGTKFLALIYSPLLLAFGLTTAVRRRLLWAAPGVAIGAAPWYLHNWWLTGSPVYPVSLAFGGFTIARGAYPRAVLNNTGWQHLPVSHIAKLPGILADAAGRDLLLAIMPLAALGLYAAYRRRAWRVLLVTLVVPLAMVLLFWYGVPFNNAFSARYIFPATALFLLLAAMAFEITAALSRYLHVVFAAILLWLVAGTSTALIEPRFLLLYGSLAVLVALVIASVPRRAVVLTLLLVCEAAAAGVFAASMRACPGDGCALLRTNPFTRPTLFRAWDWMSHHV
ncbi:MAG TPA: hypothetical protein VIC33_17275, partial [Vicinamibacterales bacterium]